MDVGNRPGVSMPRARGAALLAFLLVLIAVIAVLAFNDIPRKRPVVLERETTTARSLGDARSALVAWAAVSSVRAGRAAVPGVLPFPDRNRDGNYDGKGDCVTFGLNDGHLLGRLPWAGNGRPCPPMGLNVEIRDGAGEPLWYAVSRNLLVRGGGGPINSQIGEAGRAVYPWIRLRDARGNIVTGHDGHSPLAIAAVIIAPGEALEGQDRSAPTPGAREFLDSIAVGAMTVDNADADGCPDTVAAPCGSPSWGEEFIAHPESARVSGFNDRLAYITVDELMRAVEKRVLGEAAIALNRYRRDFGAYPWLAHFRDPRALAPAPATAFKSALTRTGLLPVHLPGERFATGFGGFWRFVDSTPTTTVRHSGVARLVPPLPDGMSGLIQVAGHSGRCVWSDWTRGDCEGSRVIPAHYRADLGVTVRRTLEYAFRIVDAAPRVTPPTPLDVRRRSLSVNAGVLPASPPGRWNVRITDDDGINQGQRDIAIDGDTGGEITLSGIRYDLSVVYDDRHDARDELPEWFVENQWHHLVYAAFSADAVAGGNADGDDDCRTPFDNCLTLNAAGRAVPAGVRGLVISPGAALAHQDRLVGDCNGDGVADNYLCAYFEGANSDRSTPRRADTYLRGEFTRHFNDQVRIVDPPP